MAINAINDESAIGFVTGLLLVAVDSPINTDKGKEVRVKKSFSFRNL